MTREGQQTVLVTGGTGYLASWVIAGLLERGYRVRTTVRRRAAIDRIRSAVGAQLTPARVEEIDFAVTDLLADDGWDEAVAGVDYVLHTAAAMALVGGQDVVQVSREGVRRVLGAAGRAGVKRVVLTSSAVTAIPADPSGVAVETVWAVPADAAANAAETYNAAKTLAERDAWELAGTTGLDLVAVLPTFMQGPILGAPSPDGSVQIVQRLLTGQLPAIPRIGWDIVDVRDIADLHILAMINAEAAGQRLIGSGRFLWWREVAMILREQLPAEARKVPSRTMPDLAVKLIARFNPRLAMISPNLGRQTKIDGGKARTMLGWQPRPVGQTIVDTATSLIAKEAAAA